MLDPDFIAICENLDVCPKTLTAKAQITSLTVTPTKGPQGQTFDINLSYQVTSKLGTGMLIVQVNPSDGSMPLQEVLTLVALPPAGYTLATSVNTQPTQGTLQRVWPRSESANLRELDVLKIPTPLFVTKLWPPLSPSAPERCAHPYPQTATYHTEGAFLH